MMVVIQRVKRASVKVGERYVAAINHGLLVLLGVHRDDSEKDVDYLLKKVPNLRIFEDESGKMNLSLIDVEGEVIVVSQFTLLARTRKGRRPSFDDAAPPEKGRALYRMFVDGLRNQGIKVQEGVFGEHMEIELVNDGPVTIIMNSKEV